MHAHHLAVQTQQAPAVAILHPAVPAHVAVETLQPGVVHGSLRRALGIVADVVVAGHAPHRPRQAGMGAGGIGQVRLLARAVQRHIAGVDQQVWPQVVQRRRDPVEVAGNSGEPTPR